MPKIGDLWKFFGTREITLGAFEFSEDHYFLFLYDDLTQWFSIFLTRGTLKETKIFSRHIQANFDRKILIFRLVEKNLRHPLYF
jgi:hypothetical protein